MPEVHVQLTIVQRDSNADGKQVIAFGPEAKRYAYFARLDADLQLVGTRCDLYDSELSSEAPRVSVLSALAESAFVTYGRFADGAGGNPPSEILSQLDPRLLRLHRWAMAIRTKHVGHSVSTLNQTLALAAISNHDGFELQDVFAVNMRYVMSEGDVQELREVAAALRRVLSGDLSNARIAALDALSRDPAASYDNPQVQLELVQRAMYDYVSDRREVHGTLAVPANLERESYGDLGEAR